MSLLKYAIIPLSFLMLLACENQPKKSNSDKSSVSVEKQNAETTKTRAKASPDLTKYGIANYAHNELGGLNTGDVAPDFKLQNQDGKEESLYATLEEGPVLLVFLRADWCSYCVKHLQEFQDNIEEIHQAGQANVIAISPQESSYMKKFHEENQLSFPILFDIDHVAMKDYKVFFRVTEKYNNKIEKAKGNRVEVYNGDTNAYLPVPATYLIDQNKTIKYVHYDPNYKMRSNLKQVMAQLKS